MIDIYYDLNYAKLYENVEKGKAVAWRYEGVEGSVLHQFMLREIPLQEAETIWYDLVTPYGYGGPIIEKVNAGHTKSDLLEAFERDFSKYCKDNNVVSEFVRFHPILQNALDFKEMYNATMIRHTLGTNLKDYDDPVSAEFSKSCRKHIRQSLNKGVTWRITEQPENIDVFKEIYFSTMDRNHAQDYYYFDDAYFHQCLQTLRSQIIFVEALFEEKTIAAGLYFISNGIIHAHLSGTISEYLHLSPAYVLKYATACWGKEHGYALIHYGGGRSNQADDPLFVFKKKFAQNTQFEFYIGKKVWNQEQYSRLCEMEHISEEIDFFPAYRK